MSSPDFDDAENFRDFSNVLADQVKEMEALAYMIPPKDIHSRHVSGFAIFTSAQKLDLLTKISAALSAAAKGNPEPGDKLLKSLTKQFAYLSNRELDGVQV